MRHLAIITFWLGPPLLLRYTKGMQLSEYILYPCVAHGVFVARPNRFVARVLLEGQEVVCHVKNTGRCSELLLPGARVVLVQAQNPTRKTGYDLVAVYKGDMLVNIDSQAPNSVAARWLRATYPGAVIRAEVPWQHSRLDFLVQHEGRSLYVEVKGCTLEEDGLALFPDAPTPRGVRHLRALGQCVAAGHEAMALFVIQLRPVKAFSPHDRMHPAFGQALREVYAAGVQVLARDCVVTPQGMAMGDAVPVLL